MSCEKHAFKSSGLVVLTVIIWVRMHRSIPLRKQESVEDTTRFKLLIISSLDMGHEDHSEGVADGVVELDYPVQKLTSHIFN